jgi:rhodanese-related sulfurtransferase
LFLKDLSYLRGSTEGEKCRSDCQFVTHVSGFLRQSFYIVPDFYSQPHCFSIAIRLNAGVILHVLVGALHKEQKNMNSKHVLTSVLLAIGLLVGPLSFAGDSKDTTTAMIDVGAARDYVNAHEDAIVIDVRTPAEYEMSHITDAINVNVQDESFAQMAGALDPHKTYIVHCTKNPADGRSSRALETLRELGFSNLYSLEGGYVAWKEADLPLTETDN